MESWESSKREVSYILEISIYKISLNYLEGCSIYLLEKRESQSISVVYWLVTFSR